MFLKCSRRRYSLPGNREEGDMTDWQSPVDRFLYSVGRMGLEPVLCDGCLSGRVPEAVTAVASIEPELHRRVTEDDGGSSEHYCGFLIVAGVRYRFEVLVFADADGAHFLANIASFEPLEWRAGIRVA
jgi:hypothetical protein